MTDEWALDAIDADPRNRSLVDPMEEYVARVRAREQEMGLEPAYDPEPEPPDDIELVTGDRSVALSSIDTSPPPPMLIDRLDPTGHTILFGPGGVGKGALACWWIVQLVRSGQRVLILDYEGHPEEWARRIHSLDPLAYSGDAIRHLRPLEAIGRATGEIAVTCDVNEITYVVVDSAVMACGTDPLKPEAAADYDKAFLEIGRPMLTLAHVTKIDDGRYPFGSVFWHNLARMTWSLAADGESTILKHRKHNNYKSSGAYHVKATWTDTGQLGEVWDSKPYAQSVLERALEVIPETGATLSEIRLDINDGEGKEVSADTLRRTLARAIPDRVRLVGERYHRAD